MNDLELFEDSFQQGISSCRARCQCGQQYYNEDGGWDWDKGEIEQLESEKAINVDCSITLVLFEGKRYCDVCDCWKERASKLIEFIRGHHRGIAVFLNKIKDREIEEAKNLPSVEGHRTASSS